MSSQRLAFVDLETTGGNPARDRITEIGVVRMIDGEVVDEWSSLVNPQCPIPAEIQALTGITTAMVRDAPSFDALADTVADRLAGWTFVAHNARFDYGFLKGEFRRLDRRFLADVLCTVRLSRRLDPGHARHGLDAVAERHHLGSLDRHRALGDARLIARFYQLMRRTRPLDELDAAVAHLLKRPALPPHVAEEELLGLPDEPGVYVLRGVNDLPIYVGKAKNLRERVFAHFYADSRNANDARLAAEVRSVSYEETAGEFSALLREIDWIRQSTPLHNVALRKRADCCFIELIDADDPRQLGNALLPRRKVQRAALCVTVDAHVVDGRRGIGRQRIPDLELTQQRDRAGIQGIGAQIGHPARRAAGIGADQGHAQPLAAERQREAGADRTAAADADVDTAASRLVSCLANRLVSCLANRLVSCLMSRLRLHAWHCRNKHRSTRLPPRRCRKGVRAEALTLVAVPASGLPHR